MNDARHYSVWIPETVRKLRGDKTLSDVAARANISVSYLSDIERGRTIPTLETLDSVFTACGVVLTLGFKPLHVHDSEWTCIRRDTIRQIIGLLNDEPA